MRAFLSGRPRRAQAAGEGAPPPPRPPPPARYPRLNWHRNTGIRTGICTGYPIDHDHVRRKKRSTRVFKAKALAGWLACAICVLRPQLLPVIGPAAVVVFLITYRVCRREICRDLPPIDPPSDRNATNSCLDGQHRCRAGYAASAVQKRNENIVSDANRPLLRLDKAGRRPSAGHSRERVPPQHLVTP